VSSQALMALLASDNNKMLALESSHQHLNSNNSNSTEPTTIFMLTPATVQPESVAMGTNFTARTRLGVKKRSTLTVSTRQVSKLTLAMLRHAYRQTWFKSTLYHWRFSRTTS